ncbi:hypothetical protein [Nonomuraea sp. NPDC052265]|uniref:hypothetical protein n=1 Tax=Nonomuraea sp. NPDC052265 TaxID=3364374 RepID=UPI0037C8DC7E
MSDTKARALAVQLQGSLGGRWQVMWEPYLRVFTAYPAYDHRLNTPVKADNLREVWRRILDVDQVLLEEMAKAIPAHPPAVVHVPPGFLQEVLG